jgi:hypothetical protein
LVVFLPMAVQAARTWIRREVTIEFQGRNASGSRGAITVSTVFYGRKSTHVGGSTPASLARIMLRESGSISAAQPMSASHRKRPNCHAATK